MKLWVRYRIPLGIAAAVLVIAGAFTLALQTRRPSEPATASLPQQHADPALPAAERQILERTLSTGRFERAPVLEGLIARPGALLSSTQDKRPFELLTPVGTTVLIDRPILRWSMAAAASSYVVSIFDEKSQKVAESPVLTATEWHPADPLPRGKVLNWQVTARTASGTIREPAPAAAEARFQIVPVEAAQHIDAIRRDFPGNPLLLAALYAHAGALDEADAMLTAMESRIAQSFRESIRKIRRGE
jgi:hypothetical protein